MRRVATAEDPPVIRIPLIVGVTVVRLEPQLVLVVFDVEDVQVAIGVRERANGHQEHHPLITLWVESNS